MPCFGNGRPEIGGRHRPDEAGPDDSCTVGDDRDRNRVHVILAMQRRRVRILDIDHSDLRARQNLGFANHVGARNARGRGEHSNQPRCGGIGEIGAIDLRRGGEHRLRRGVDPMSAA